MQTVQEDDKAPLSGDPRTRIMRLEKSITWLQDQHCNMVAYCSNRCRVAGTAEHRLECLILSRSHYRGQETEH